jgi:hypothetical protein
MKKRQLVAALALAIGTVGTSHAVLFDADGAGGLTGPLDVNSFDWSTTSFLALGGNQAIQQFATQSCPVGGCTFTVLTQATLGSVTLANGQTVTPLGMNSVGGYEITMIASFTEQVTGIVPTASGTEAQFATVTSAPAFVEFFFSRSVDSIPLTGSGYNDGTVILRGTLVGDATGNFTVTPGGVVPLDQTTSDAAPNNDYPGQDTVTGFGSTTNLPVGGITSDPTFFLQALQSLGITFLNISQALPFQSVDPSDCFTRNSLGTPIGSIQASYACDTNHVLGPFSAQTALVNGVVPNTGPVNGLFAGGPDFVAQTDFNSTFQVRTVPEPGSLALLGLGLGALGFAGRRKTQG